ncbi:unnamed protein product [Dovyalis caffra]|uniref:Uncharacterized protein n=1 Tax=Dovyalis caffra TaxID=77055 RepID=A0AAV1R9U6_9ROSI|nr:unnamed protein product [Dovyalis caffra]
MDGLGLDASKPNYGLNLHSLRRAIDHHMSMKLVLTYRKTDTLTDCAKCKLSKTIASTFLGTGPS